MRTISLLSTLFVLMLLNGCGNPTPSATNNPTAPSVEFANGVNVYKKHCTACHQAGGTGIPGAFPPIKNNAIFAGDNAQLIQIVLKGMTGPVEVNGVKYNGIMVGFPNLSDKEIADVINYSKQELNANTDFVTEKDVLRVRNQ